MGENRLRQEGWMLMRLPKCVFFDIFIAVHFKVNAHSKADAYYRSLPDARGGVDACEGASIRKELDE